MSIINTTYILLLIPIFIIIYYCPIIKSIKIRNVLLILASIFFYTFGDINNLCLLIISILVNYLITFVYYKTKNKIIIYIGIAYDVAILCAYKYIFIDKNFPLGLSYYTFMEISYLVDSINLIEIPKLNKAFMYILFFPTISSGPITRYRDFDKQINERIINYDCLFRGIERFALGFIKIKIISDYLFIIECRCFSDIVHLSVISSWIGIIAYSLELYYNFSGYSDIAIGLANMFGFEIAENFNYPYCASSISEFWKKWHISLTKWFTNYIYIPLGGNKVSKFRHIINLLIVWIITGLWHGNGLTFIIWAMIHFIFQLLEKYTNISKMPKWIGHIYTLFVVMIGWVFFRSKNISDALFYIKSMFGLCGNTFVDSKAINYLKGFYIPIILGILFSLPIYRKYRNSSLYNNFIVNIIVSLSICVLFALCILSQVGFSFSASLYQKF